MSVLISAGSAGSRRLIHAVNQSHSSFPDPASDDVCHLGTKPRTSDAEPERRTFQVRILSSLTSRRPALGFVDPKRIVRRPPLRTVRAQRCAHVGQLHDHRHGQPPRSSDVPLDRIESGRARVPGLDARRTAAEDVSRSGAPRRSRPCGRRFSPGPRERRVPGPGRRHPDRRGQGQDDRGERRAPAMAPTRESRTSAAT